MFECFIQMYIFFLTQMGMMEGTHDIPNKCLNALCRYIYTKLGWKGLMTYLTKIHISS